MATPHPISNHPRFHDLTGKKYGRLLVLGYSGNCKWLCRCDCGKEKDVLSQNIQSGASSSCGCRMMEVSRTLLLTHGATVDGKETSEHISWRAMTDRCRNKSHVAWKYYGGRGITVCERWYQYENFLADMGSKPTPKHSIDRIDPDGNYEPGNCRWATVLEQRHNRRKKVTGCLPDDKNHC